MTKAMRTGAASEASPVLKMGKKLVAARDLLARQEATSFEARAFDRVLGLNRPRNRIRHAVEVRRQPAVAVVEPDDVEATVDDALAELDVPVDHLAAEPHDEEHGRVGRVAEGLVAEGHLAEVADDARLRSLVSETPLADREHQDAQRHADAMHRHRAEVLDQISRLEQTQDELLETLPDARLEVYEGVGHAVHWERPERFGAWLGGIGVLSQLKAEAAFRDILEEHLPGFAPR